LDLPTSALDAVMSLHRPPAATESGPPIAGLIGTSPAMEAVYRLTRKVAKTNASVLLLGETGTGKEMIATAIHRLSQRTTGPFVRVNCGALSESLLESELFGHVRGAFTGAVNNRTGRFEAAHTGSIFLDEINSTSLFLQVKLLRVLQEREFERVGDTTTNRVDVRVIAASNRELYAEVEAERFREDLYWRLNVVPIVIPPLRLRRDDIPALVAHFLNVYSQKNEKNVVHIQAEAIAALQDYHWPGNVRELQNYVERAVAMADGDELTVDLLPDTVLGRGERRSGRMRGVDMDSLVFEVVQQGLSIAPAEETNLHEKIVNRVERELIVQVMESCGKVQTKAATRLGINRNTLRSKLQQYNLEEQGTE
jgi:transcriptional regulator with PAS, ATPase and Fis domain